MTYEAALTDPEFQTPGKSRGLWDVFRQRYLLSLLLKKGVATRYYGSVLGWAWSYVRPAAQFLMYYLVIGVLLGADRGMKLFPVYLFCGIIAVNLFSEALRASTNSVVGNAPLIKKLYLPRELFPVSAVGIAFIHFLPQAVILLIICLVLGWTFTWMQLLAFIFGLTLILIFALGLGLFFGAINVAYRDAGNFVDLILMFSTWASPVLYSALLLKERAPEWLFNVYMINPVTAGVELFHNSFWLPIASGSPRPDHIMLNGAIALAIALVTLLIGQFVFRKMEGNFAQNL